MFEPLPSSLAGGQEGQSKGAGGNKHAGGLSFDTGQLVAKRSVCDWLFVGYVTGVVV